MESLPPDWTADDYEEARALVRELGADGGTFDLDQVHREALRRRAHRSLGNGGRDVYRMMAEPHQVARVLTHLERDAVIVRLGLDFRFRLAPPPKPARATRHAYQGGATLSQGDARADSVDCIVLVGTESEWWGGRLAVPKGAGFENGLAELQFGEEKRTIRLTLVAPSGFCEFEGEGLPPRARL